MQVVEKINFLLQEKNMSKKEFAEKLKELSPKLYATGDVPSEQTIYRYSKEIREIVELLPHAPNNVVTYIKEQLSKYKLLNENITSKPL